MPPFVPDSRPSADARLAAKERTTPLQLRILAVSIYLGTAASIILSFRFGYHWFTTEWFQYRWYEGSWYAAPCLDYLRDPYVVAALLAAAVLFVVPVRAAADRKSGYAIGLTAALMAWPVFLRNELQHYRLFNSWIALDFSGIRDPGLPNTKPIIIAVSLLLVATFYSALRLLPERWRIGQFALRDRLWLPFALSFPVVAAWYLTAIALYQPLRPSGAFAELSVVRVEKHGFRFRKTTVAVTRDWKLYVERDDRSLFEFRHQLVYSWGFVPEDACRSLKGIIASPQFRGPVRDRGLRPPRYPGLRVWKSDRWFVYFDGVPGKNLSNINESAVPREILALYYSAQRTPKKGTERRTVRDVCLGFCYDATE